jgi:GntR family histidine utilization transcriptional repressor
MTGARTGLTLDGAGAVYDQIYRAIAQPILTGLWEPGRRIPSEHQLTERFGCSRMTVNRALSALAREGLILRQRKRGSFVASQPTEQSVLEIADMASEIQRSGRRYDYELLRRTERRAMPGELPWLELSKRAPILDIRCRHRADGVAIQLEHRLISLAAVPEAAAVDFADEPPGTWLLRLIPWSEAEQEITALAADADDAAQLGIPAGSACLAIRRRTWRAGKVVTGVTLLHPGDRRRLLARFTPARQPDRVVRARGTTGVMA